MLKTILSIYSALLLYRLNHFLKIILLRVQIQLHFKEITNFCKTLNCCKKNLLCKNIPVSGRHILNFTSCIFKECSNNASYKTNFDGNLKISATHKCSPNSIWLTQHSTIPLFFSHTWKHVNPTCSFATFHFNAISHSIIFRLFR